jgi:hypothetical protein
MHVFLVSLLFILANIRTEFSQAVKLGWKTGYTDLFLRSFMQSLPTLSTGYNLQFVVH